MFAGAGGFRRFALTAFSKWVVVNSLLTVAGAVRYVVGISLMGKLSGAKMTAETVIGEAIMSNLRHHR